MKRVTSLLVKSLIGAGLAGAVGLGGYGIYSVASKATVKTIEQALGEDSSVVLLSMTEDKDKSKWEEYVAELVKESTTSKLDGFVKSEVQEESAKKQENITKLKDICKGLLKLDSANQVNLGTAKRWCTKPK